MLNRLMKPKRQSGPSDSENSGNGHRPIIQLREIVKSFTIGAGDFTVLKGITVVVTFDE